MSKKSVHLPEELIIEILLRLTVKTLLRCKCVCKSWLSLISNPNFATSHFQLAASPTNKLVCLGNNSETLSIDFNASLNDESSYASLSYDFLPGGSCPDIVGSCRGFIFLDAYTNFYLWNPSTRVHTKIPTSPITNLPDSYINTYLYGFAYDRSTDDYSIVLGSCDSRAFDYRVPCSICFEIFSLRPNKWKHIELEAYLIIYFRYHSNTGLLLNDSIHWMVHNYDETLTDDIIEVIIAFDLKESKMSKIALPYGFDSKDDSSNHDLLVFGGLISASIVEMHTIKIWVMKKYAVHSSWTKILEFSVDPALHGSLSIVCFTNCGDIIGKDDEGGLIKFNDKGKLLEHHSGPKSIDSKTFEMAVYTESLLSLPCGIEQV
ncbi:F-box protein CPR1-like [Lathyrus oleraceus]|uniref:F-box protein CPR1-like n=1 Tax=Pisum sativum TaxID=3888 RepID=UPI001FC3D7E4|nr:F-box protein CPR1-like [Pisum sativum]